MRLLPVVPLAIALPLVVNFTSAHVSLTDDLAVAVTKEEAASTTATDSNGRAKSKLGPMLVKLTPVETAPPYARLAAALDSASRTAISGIPGITILGRDDDEVAAAKKSRKPVVVLSGKLQNIATTKQGDEVEFRALIQYVIYRIPGRDVAAVLDGSARTRIAAVQVRSKEGRQQVEDVVAAAAVESAARRAPAALLAISK
jgi:hypothetical protein